MKNAETNVGRIVKVVVLDRPVPVAGQNEGTSKINSPRSPDHIMNALPSFTYRSHNHVLDHGVVYMTPLLAFNLGLHVSCLNLLLQEGQDSLKSLFQVEGNEEVTKSIDHSKVHVELIPWTHLPRNASHLRISFVKVPECGMLGSLKGASKPEEDDRQLMIDSALNEYFKVDRYLARGDIFCIQINWNCGSEMCVACSRDATKTFSRNIIYFKVNMSSLLFLSYQNFLGI